MVPPAPPAPGTSQQSPELQNVTAFRQLSCTSALESAHELVVQASTVVSSSQPMMATPPSSVANKTNLTSFIIPSPRPGTRGSDPSPHLSCVYHALSRLARHKTAEFLRIAAWRRANIQSPSHFSVHRALRSRLLHRSRICAGSGTDARDVQRRSLSMGSQGRLRRAEGPALSKDRVRPTPHRLCSGVSVSVGSPQVPGPR